jgi:isopentenyldiphosphate isomerase
MINANELLFIVNEDNQPIMPKSRQETHTNGYWHRTTQIWIINHKRQILCQKRSLKKDTYPGKWEPFFGGHVLANQEYLDSAAQELNEELGLNIPKEKLTFVKIHKSQTLKEFQAVYYIIWEGDEKTIKYEKDEIDTLKWVDSEELYHTLINQENNWSIPNYTQEIFAILRKKLAKKN